MSTDKKLFTFLILLLLFLTPFALTSANNIFVFNRNLTLGSMGQDVKELQKFLNTNGFIVAESGPGSFGEETTKFGALTKTALIKYQKSNKITPTVGYYGPITRGLVNKQISVKSIASVDTNQNNLNSIKHDFVASTTNSVSIYRNSIATYSLNYTAGTHGSVDSDVLQYIKRGSDGTPITATPNTNYHFVNWSDASTDNPRTDTNVTSNISVTANFAIDTHTLTYTAGAHGSITGTSPQTVDYGANGSAVTAAPDTGYSFVSWSDGVLTAARTDLNVTADKSVTANFAAIIDTAPIAGITAPVKSATPTATIADTLEYTATISWSGNPVTFDPNTVYTATITLIAKSGYTLIGVPANFFTVAGAVTTNAVDSGVISAVFPATEKLTVASPSFTPSAEKIPIAFKPVGSSSTVGTSVSIASDTSGASIYYTTDGSDPTALSTLYTGQVTLNTTTTVKAIGIKDQYNNSSIASSVYTLNQSSSGVFAWPHGTVQVGDKFYMAARTSPATITVFNDPNDLTNNQTVTLTGHNSMDSLVYDSVNDKLYGSVYDGASKLTIIQIDPQDITQWSVVYDSVGPSNNTLTAGTSPIVTDGTYVYGATYRSVGALSRFFKIRISDWSYITTTKWGTAIADIALRGGRYPHAAALVSYADRNEMYVTTTYDVPIRFAKVNLTDMTYSEVFLGTAVGDPVALATDDMACKYVNESGATCYVGSDITSTRQVGYEVNTATMGVTEFSLDGTYSYGMFIYGNDLYSLGSGGTITKYANLNVASPETFSTPSVTPNEFFYSSLGKFFITDWSASSKLMEFKLSE